MSSHRTRLPRNLEHARLASLAISSMHASVSLMISRACIWQVLSEDVSSLLADADRLAFSVIWQLDAQANVHSTKVVKSVIRSRASLSYAEAHERIQTGGRLDSFLGEGSQSAPHGDPSPENRLAVVKPEAPEQ